MHQLQAGAMYACSNMSHDHSDDDSTADDSFCLQVMIKHNQKKEQRVPRPTHLITNLAYTLQPHHHRNLYLRARLDTCADVNLMPASVYQLSLQRILIRTFPYNFTMHYIDTQEQQINLQTACPKWEIKKTPLDYLRYR